MSDLAPPTSSGRSETPSSLSASPSPASSPALAITGLVMQSALAAFIAACLWTGRIPKEDFLYSLAAMTLITCAPGAIAPTVYQLVKRLPGGKS